MELSDNTIPKQLKLLKKEEFQGVLRKSKKFQSRFFNAFSHTNDFPHPRIGIIVSKHKIKRAIDRNRIKRIVRESFRQHKKHLKNLDLVVLIRSECRPRRAAVPAVDVDPAQRKEDQKLYKNALRADIDQLWRTIINAGSINVSSAL